MAAKLSPEARDRLARKGKLRTVIAERFLKLTRTTPMRYLTELRMRVAAQGITRDSVPIETAAHRLGYASQAAFSRAYKRVIGHAPGASWETETLRTRNVA